jgi:hypothetical protein
VILWLKLKQLTIVPGKLRVWQRILAVERDFACALANPEAQVEDVRTPMFELATGRSLEDRRSSENIITQLAQSTFRFVDE